MPNAPDFVLKSLSRDLAAINVVSGLSAANARYQVIGAGADNWNGIYLATENPRLYRHEARDNYYLALVYNVTQMQSSPPLSTFRIWWALGHSTAENAYAPQAPAVNGTAGYAYYCQVHSENMAHPVFPGWPDPLPEVPLNAWNVGMTGPPTAGVAPAPVLQALSGSGAAVYRYQFGPSVQRPQPLPFDWQPLDGAAITLRDLEPIEYTLFVQERIGAGEDWSPAARLAFTPPLEPVYLPVLGESGRAYALPVREWSAAADPRDLQGPCLLLLPAGCSVWVDGQAG